MKGCRPLSEDEVQATLSAFEGPYACRDRALFMLGVRSFMLGVRSFMLGVRSFMLGVRSGFRISELLSLRLLDVAPRGKIVDRATVAR